MSTTSLQVVAAALFIVGVLAPAFADESPKDEPLDLADAVARSPIDLREAVRRGQTEYRVVLRAGFAYDTQGTLVLRVLLRSAPDDEAEFEEWTGPVSEATWTPRRRVISDESEAAEAERLHELVGAAKRTLTEAVRASQGVRRPDKSWSWHAISAEPVREDGEVRIVSLVSIDERLHRITQVLDSGVILSTRPAEAPPRVEVDTTTRTLPELSVPDGVWFNAEAAPTLAAWKGSPILVSVADPG